MTPPYERIFLDKLTTIHGTLLSMKNNRSHYLSSKEIYHIYATFLDLLHDLAVTRKDEELKGFTLNLPNANDSMIDDIWQLLSLCFVTCGLIKFAPATYSSLSTVYKLLGHLKECQVYTTEDLRPIGARLAEIRDIIGKERDEEEHHRREEKLLLHSKLARCEKLYRELVDSFGKIPKDLEPTYHRLISVRKSIMNYFTKDDEVPYEKGVIEGKINQFKAELKEIERLRENDGKFHSSLADSDSFQACINGLLDDCNNLISDLAIENEYRNEDSLPSLSEDEKQFEALYTQLVDLKRILENLLVTRRWTLRETDLYNYQKTLKSIDDERVRLNGSETPKSRRFHILVLYLLRRCYALIYKLLESSEPVSESLQPIHNQLLTVRRCLLEIKRIDGLSSLRDLYPFQLKLASLDNLRQDGKFIINGQIPEGQGTLNALLAECFDIIHELKIELDGDEKSGVEEMIGVVDAGVGVDDVEIKRRRYVGFNEADYDGPSGGESDYENDYY